MAIMRVMFVGHGPSDLPSDQIVNTWHFSNTETYEDHQAVVIPALTRFYSAVGGLMSGMSRCVGEWLSPWVQRDAELRAYDLNTLKPRVPTIYPMTLPAPFSGSGAVEEIALCLSLKAADPPYTPRRRGRLYFGPFNLGAINAGDVSNMTHPSQFLLDDLCFGAVGLLAIPGLDWMIRSSKPTENFVRIGSVWCDNAFDTQRRRGPIASARTLGIPA